MYIKEDGCLAALLWLIALGHVTKDSVWLCILLFNEYYEPFKCHFLLGLHVENSMSKCFMVSKISFLIDNALKA